MNRNNANSFHEKEIVHFIHVFITCDQIYPSLARVAHVLYRKNLVF